MNMLNKILVEGYVLFDSIVKDNDALDFDIKTIRFHKDKAGNGVTETFINHVSMKGPITIKVNKKLERNFDFIRVEGYLANGNVIPSFVEFSSHWREDVCPVDYTRQDFNPI